MAIKQAQLETQIIHTISLPYLIYRPITPAPHPLIIYLHGSGERGTDPTVLHDFGPNTIINQNGGLPFVVVSPQCPEDTIWDAQLYALETLLQHLLTHEQIDPDRCYLTGNSMGGYGTWFWAEMAPQHFAAIVPICGGGIPWLGERLKNVPVWAFHGDADDAVDLGESARMVNAVSRSGGSAEFTVYPGVGHDSWSQTYLNPDLYDWLQSHRRQSDSE